MTSCGLFVVSILLFKVKLILVGKQLLRPRGPQRWNRSSACWQIHHSSNLLALLPTTLHIEPLQSFQHSFCFIVLVSTIVDDVRHSTHAFRDVSRVPEYLPSNSFLFFLPFFFPHLWSITQSWVIDHTCGIFYSIGWRSTLVNCIEVQAPAEGVKNINVFYLPATVRRSFLLNGLARNVANFVEIRTYIRHLHKLSQTSH